MYILIHYALQFVGQPYRWGGDDPVYGFDCSGLVQELLASVGMDPPGDQTAHALYEWFIKRGEIGKRGAGALAFFGKGGRISHVGFCLDEHFMLEAGGGHEKVLNRKDAAYYNAYVRIRPINHRSDIIAIVMPEYSQLK